TISTFGGTLQMLATILPVNAEDQSIIWSVENVSGEATISSTGLLTALENGTVVVKATSVNQPNIQGTRTITISNQDVYATSIEVNSAGNVAIIDTFGGTLQFSVVVLPADTDNKAVVWSVIKGTGEATINASGLLTAQENGTVTVRATSVTNPLVFGSKVITISKQEVLATWIGVLSAGDATVINTFGGTLQFSVNVIPANTDDKSVIWSVINGTGEATISSTGLLTALENGTVTVKATATTDPLVFGTKVITISNQEVLATSVELSSAGDALVINTFGGTLQFSAVVLPLNADDKSVLYSVESGTGQASISSLGLLTALENGTVTVKVSVALNPLLFDTMVITISNQEVLVESVTVSAGNVTTIDTFGGTLQLNANVLPADADNKAVIWSVENVSGEATISSTGLLTALENGTVLVKATSVENPLIFGTLEITISNQEVLVESITVSAAGDVIVIDTFGGTLQLSANVLPADADNKLVIWSVESITGLASISETGLLTALENGTVLVKATSVENSAILGSLEITISNQEVLVESVTVSTVGEVIVIETFGGTLQLNANVLPADADNKLVIWSVEGITGQASISEAGLLTALENGTVLVKATSVENPLIYGTLEITISNQEVLVESITVSADGDVVIIDVLGGTLQMNALVLPLNADDQLYTWTVENVSGAATISETGLLTAVADGTVLVKATLDSDPLIFGSLEITISNQEEVIVSGGVELLSAGDFTILSKTGISTTAGSYIVGNLGVSPGPASYITGFDLINDASNTFATSALVTGMIYAADFTAPTPSYLSTAISDMETAYTDAAGRAPDFTELHAGDISGQTLVPGVYYWSSGLLINTDVTLAGSETDIWIFQIAGTLTQAPGAKVMLSGGAVASNIVWQVAAAVSIGVGSHFEGTILGMTSVDLGTNATYNGKIFAQTAVSLDSNDINN
ncbi:MAG: Ig-like domain-containing protein, partial [Acholeplasmataceae bacterium]|nr:Ig-like domain-containing protein [Acholeplasmataceae bacterium]